MSATPNWTADDQGDSTEILDAGGDPVGRIYRSDDADLIVRAVNTHDALVEALERTKRALELAFTGKPLRDMTETLAEADAALAKAKEVG